LQSTASLLCLRAEVLLPPDQGCCRREGEACIAGALTLESFC